jgi:hypothetical protein
MSVAQDLFLGIVSSVETGLITPERAVIELDNLKQEYGFKSEYTLADFQRIRTDYLSELLDDDDEYYDERRLDSLDDEEDDE